MRNHESGLIPTAVSSISSGRNLGVHVAIDHRRRRTAHRDVRARSPGDRGDTIGLDRETAILCRRRAGETRKTASRCSPGLGKTRSFSISLHFSKSSPTASINITAIRAPRYHRRARPASISRPGFLRRFPRSLARRRDAARDARRSRWPPRRDSRLRDDVAGRPRRPFSAGSTLRTAGGQRGLRSLRKTTTRPIAARPGTIRCSGVRSSHSPRRKRPMARDVRRRSHRRCNTC